MQSSGVTHPLWSSSIASNVEQSNGYGDSIADIRRLMHGRPAVINCHSSCFRPESKAATSLIKAFVYRYEKYSLKL